jgi:hypothetical protein
LTFETALIPDFARVDWDGVAVFGEKLTVLGVSMELLAEKGVFPDEAGKKADVAIEATMIGAGELQALASRLCLVD